MATASITNTFVAGTSAEAAEVNTNFTNLVTFLNNSVVHVDGSKAMTSNFDAGSNKIVNLTDGTSAQDAVSKSQLDTATGAGAWTSYTPTFSGTIGNGTLSGRYVRIGRTIHFEATVTWGSTTSHPASVQFMGLPVTAASQNGQGTVSIDQGGTGRRWSAAYVTTSSITGINEIGQVISDTLPVTTWTTGHTWSVSGTYEAAS